jgi:hypothetical protein
MVFKATFSNISVISWWSSVLSEWIFWYKCTVSQHISFNCCMNIIYNKMQINFDFHCRILFDIVQELCTLFMVSIIHNYISVSVVIAIILSHDHRYVPFVVITILVTNNKLQNTTQKTKDWATWSPIKTLDKQFLLHMQHPSCYSCYEAGDKSWMGKEQDCDYDKRNISVVMWQDNSNNNAYRNIIMNYGNHKKGA